MQDKLKQVNKRRGQAINAIYAASHAGLMQRSLDRPTGASLHPNAHQFDAMALNCEAGHTGTA
jgi:hypothetical protein